MRVIPHDDKDLAYTVNAIRVGLGGTVRLKTYDGVVRVFPVTAGTIISLPVRRIYRTGTTAGEFQTDLVHGEDNVTYRTPVPFAGPQDVPGPQPGPTAYFSFTPTSGTSSTSIAFTDESVGTPTAWLWERNNGSGWTTFSTSQNPTTTFTDDTWSIRLTVSNTNGSDSDTQTDALVIFTPVVASFTSSKPDTIYSGDLITFTDTSTGSPDTWLWERNYGPGWETFSTDQNPLNVNFAEATWTLRFTASKLGSSDQVVASGYINVSPMPAAGVFYSGETASWSDVGAERPRLTQTGAPTYSEGAVAPRWSRRIDYQISYDDRATWSDSVAWNGLTNINDGVFANVVEDSTQYSYFTVRYRIVLALSGYDDIVGSWQDIDNSAEDEQVYVYPNMVAIGQFTSITWNYTRSQLQVSSTAFDIPEGYGTVDSVKWRAYHEYTGNEYTDYATVSPTSMGFTLPFATNVEYEDVIHVLATPVRTVKGPGGTSVPYEATEFEVATDFASTPTITPSTAEFVGIVSLGENVTLATNWAVSFTSLFIGAQITLRWTYDDSGAGTTTLFTQIVNCSDMSYSYGPFTLIAGMFYTRTFTGSYDFGLGGGYTDGWGLVTPNPP